MPLEKIIERISEEFSLEVDKIRKETQDRVNEILKEAQGKANSVKERILKSASFDAKRKREHILTMANLEARRMVLEEKERLIEEAYRKALAKLKRLGKKPYQELIKKMLLKIAKSEPGRRPSLRLRRASGSKRRVSGPEGEVILSKEDRKRITPSFIKSINKDLKISKEDREISGGFILKREKIEINNSFESLFRSKREELELRLVKILFK
jgi:V/A-type H+-transporting ATPase subunit E